MCRREADSPGLSAPQLPASRGLPRRRSSAQLAAAESLPLPAITEHMAMACWMGHQQESTTYIPSVPIQIRDSTGDRLCGHLPRLQELDPCSHCAPHACPCFCCLRSPYLEATRSTSLSLVNSYHLQPWCDGAHCWQCPGMLYLQQLLRGVSTYYLFHRLRLKIS